MSEKVAADFLLYQAVERIGNAFFLMPSIANKQVSEKSAIRHGVLLPIALSDHWR